MPLPPICFSALLLEIIAQFRIEIKDGCEYMPDKQVLFRTESEIEYAWQRLFCSRIWISGDVSTSEWLLCNQYPVCGFVRPGYCAQNSQSVRDGTIWLLAESASRTSGVFGWLLFLELIFSISSSKSVVWVLQQWNATIKVKYQSKCVIFGEECFSTLQRNVRYSQIDTRGTTEAAHYIRPLKKAPLSSISLKAVFFVTDRFRMASL